ncbi:pirin family protein [Serratia sp. CY76391]|uniref:pirin family protein n=1 Tax=Serratia sp. CY76391 TaxID=3383681 RepID=UPI003F9EC8C8
MSPSDLGQVLKPFVFLDLFEADQRTMAMLANMPLHPHSGIATVTVPLEGAFHFRSRQRRCRDARLWRGGVGACRRWDVARQGIVRHGYTAHPGIPALAGPARRTGKR